MNCNNKDTTDITIILDRSGSMECIKDYVVEGFNSFIASQRELPGTCRVSLMQFDDKLEEMYTDRPLDGVPLLNLQPRGFTRLFDAIGTTIKKTKERISNACKCCKPSRVIIVCCTDGAENASKEYNRQQIMDMIIQQRDENLWTFIFIGCNMDGIKDAQSSGFQAKACVSYDPTYISVKKTFQDLSGSICGLRSMSAAQYAHNVATGDVWSGSKDDVNKNPSTGA